MVISLVLSEILSTTWEWRIKYFLETYRPCLKWLNIMISTSHLLKKLKIFLSFKKNKELPLLLKKNNPPLESCMMILGNKSVSKMLLESLSPVFFMSVTGLKSFRLKSPKNFIKRSSLPIKKSSKLQANKDCMYLKKAKSKFTPIEHQGTKSISRRFWGRLSRMSRWKCLIIFMVTLSWCQTRL